MTEPSPLAEEATRLLAAVQDWLAGAPQPGHAHIATGAPECAWCPICRAVSLLRGDHPEVTAKLLEAGTTFLATVRAVLEAGAAPPEADPPARPRPTRLHRIDLDDAAGGTG